MEGWPAVATTDPATVADWWAPGRVYADHGVGLALGWQDTPYGSRCVFAIDLDEHKPDQSGAAAWARLQQEHGDAPETVMAATAGGGVHLLFACETNVRNGKIAPGVDVRGQGGQIAVFPTLHPFKACLRCLAGEEHPLVDYAWIEGRAPWEYDLADAPDWLIELVTETEQVPEPRRVTLPTGASSGRIATEMGPADILREHWNWQDRLAAAGWQFHHAEGSDEHWTRPGKDTRAGVSAVLHTDTGVFVLFSSDASVHTLRSLGSINSDGSVSLTPFNFFAATAHGGDTSAAAGAIRRKHNAEQAAKAASQLVGNQAVTGSQPTGPRIIDPDDIEAEAHRLAVEEVERIDAEARGEDVDDLGLIDWNEAFGNHAPEVPIVKGLIFPGRWTALVAPAKAGKSTWALHVAHRLARGIDPWDSNVLLPGGPMAVLYLDAEMGRLDTVGRLTAIGLVASDLDNLAYTDLPHKFDRIETASWLARAANVVQPSVVILDGINGFVSGAEKDDTPWRMLYEFAIAPLKRAGIAVISTDNTGKEEDRGARGSTVKTDKADAIFTMRAARDDYHNHQAILTRKHARTGAFIDQLRLQVNGIGTGQVDYVLPGAAPSAPLIVTRDDILRVCRTLTGLGVPTSASVQEAAKELRMEGFSIRTSLIQAAVEYRREGNPVDMDGEHLTTLSASQLVEEIEPMPTTNENNLF